MKIPECVLVSVTQEEATKLAKLYQSPELYKAYLNKLKNKYQKLYVYLDTELKDYQQAVVIKLIEKDKK